MVPSVLIYALTGVLLSACLAMAIKSDRRRRGPTGGGDNLLVVAAVCRL
jgi:hypothetical protein